MQALKDAGMTLSVECPPPAGGPARPAPSGAQAEQALTLCRAVHKSLAEQAEGWKHRSIFERQWVIRDFRNTAGQPVERWLDVLSEMERRLAQHDLPAAQSLDAPLDKLTGYYHHLEDLARGYEKDPVKLEDSLLHLIAWQNETKQLAAALNGA
jgi:hypothetical protein